MQHSLLYPPHCDSLYRIILYAYILSRLLYRYTTLRPINKR